MNRIPFRSLLGGVVMATLCFGIACGDDDATEPTFEVDTSDASVDASADASLDTDDTDGDNTDGEATTGHGNVDTGESTAPAASTTVDAGSGTGATSSEPSASDLDAGPTPDAGATGDDVATSSPPNETASTGEPEDCVRNPTTHLEIINACTTAVVIKKTPNLTGLNDDGSLPPLP